MREAPAQCVWAHTGRGTSIIWRQEFLNAAENLNAQMSVQLLVAKNTHVPAVIGEQVELSAMNRIRSGPPGFRQ